MRREWRWRGPARPWLLVRPGTGDQAWDWLLVERGRAIHEGQGQPPATREARIALIVPARYGSHFQLPAPPGLKREEWPLLLEERLLQTSDEVLCACLERMPGQLRLMVVARARLDVWRNQCADWGLQVECCWAQLQLLPKPDSASGWLWHDEDGMDLLKGVGDDGREHWLAWPRAAAEPPSTPWAQLRLEPIEGRWPSNLVDLDNLPGLFEPRRVRQRNAMPRAHLCLAVACLVLATTWGGLWLSQQWRQAQVYRDQVLAVTGPQATARQASVALRRLREEQGERRLRLRQLDGLQAQVQAWLGAHPAWRLQAVRFDGQRWHLLLQGEGSAPAWQDMASQAGARVEVSDAAQPGRWQVVFDLGDAS